jgi:hypothetical protein
MSDDVSLNIRRVNGTTVLVSLLLRSVVVQSTPAQLERRARG